MNSSPVNWSIKGQQIYLASASQTRVQLLRTAGLVFDAKPASIDEEVIKEAGIAENIEADDIAITLAELKAEKKSDIQSMMKYMPIQDQDYYKTLGC